MSDVIINTEATKKRRGRPPKARTEAAASQERSPKEVLNIAVAALEIIRATAAESEIRAIASRALAA